MITRTSAFTFPFCGKRTIDFPIRLIYNKSMELTKLVEKIAEYREKYYSVSKALTKLNEFFSRGEITEKQFNILKRDYEREIDFLSKELDTLLTQVHQEIETAEARLKELKADYTDAKIRILLGDLPPDVGKTELAKIAKEIALTEHKHAQYKAILTAQTDEEFDAIKKMSPPTTIKVENVLPIQELLKQEEELRNKRYQGKPQQYLKPLEELYNRLEKTKEFLSQSMDEIQNQKTALEEETGKLVIKIRMGGPEEQAARSKLMEVIKKVKDYDELLMKITKTIDSINERLTNKEIVMLGVEDDASKLGQIEEINLEEAAKLLEQLKKQGLEVISTEEVKPEKPIKEEKEEEKELEETPVGEQIRVIKTHKKKSPLVPVVVSLVVIFGAAFAAYRFLFYPGKTQEEQFFPNYMGNPPHNFGVYATIGNIPPRIDWSRNLQGVPSQPAINKGIIYIGTDNGKLYSVDTLGNVLWRLDLQGSILHQPLVVDNQIIVGTSEGVLYVINTSGQIIKSKSFSSGIASPPTAYGEVIYVPVFREGVYAYNINQDRVVWRFLTSGMVKNIPLVDDKSVYIADLTGNIYVVSKENGTQLNYIKTSAPIETYPILYKNYLYYGNSSGEIGCFDVKENKKIWTFNLMEPTAGSPALKDSFITYTTAFGKIVCQNATTGIRLWNFDTQNLIFSTPIIIDSFVLVSTSTPTGEFGELYCLNLHNGNLVWVLPIPKVLETAPVLWGRRLFIIGRDGTLYSMSF